MWQTDKRRGFTLVELLVAVSISSILIGVTVATYTVFRKAIAQDQNKAALSQNARVALDRISRELRQAPVIVTNLPDNVADTSVPQPGEIEFQDGHAVTGESNYLTYRRYYVSTSILKLDTIEYYFSYQAAVRVEYNSVGTGGVAPLKRVISTQDIADTVQSISFYGGPLIEFNIITSDGKQTFKARTKLYERN